VAFDVVVDGAPAHLGALSYLYTGSCVPRRGDAVEVPFGRRTAHGVVLGPGDPARATKEITKVWGSRIHPADLDVADRVAVSHFSSVVSFAARFAPRNGKGDDAIDAGPVLLQTELELPETVENRYLLRAPSLDPASLAAAAAHRLTTTHPGQVLVLCPTRALASAVVAAFDSGAALLDAPGAWAGFRAGTVRVGVGTRAAALWSPHTLAGVIVAEEEHPGHIEARQPHTNARDIAAARAHARGVPLVLTGLCPTGSGLGAKVKAAAVGEFPKVKVIADEMRTIPAAALAAAAASLRAGRAVTVIAPLENAQLRCVNCKVVRVPEQTRCPRCSESSAKLSGWDPPKVATVFPPGVRVLAPQEMLRTHVDLLIVLDADRASRRPGLEPEAALARTVLTAASMLAPGGELLLAASDPSNPALEAMRRGHLALAKVLWARARSAKLPPFGRLVKILVARKTAPSLQRWPGEVFGPRSVGEGEWEILVRIPEPDLCSLEPFINRLRRSGKLRLTVS
jgi:primosomal protein N'